MQPDFLSELPENVEIVIVDASGNLREDVNSEELSESLSDENALIWCDISSTEGGQEGPYGRLLTETFGALTVEDFFNPSRLPLVNGFGSYVFMVLFSFQITEDGMQDKALVDPDEVDLYLGRNHVVCVHPQPLAELGRIRKGLRAGDEFVSSSAANLAYTVLDAVVDEYQPAMETLAERVDTLEEELLRDKRPSESVAELEDELFVLKNHLAMLRRIIVPQRDNMDALSNPTDDRLVSEGSRKYFQDVRIHLDRVVDSLDAKREHLTTIEEAYTTRTTRRTNQQLTRLTAISTLFLPLGFITGVYGMNFIGMPELHLRYGYFVVLGVFIVITAFQIRYLHRRNML